MMRLQSINYESLDVDCRSRVGPLISVGSRARVGQMQMRDHCQFEIDE